jgi:hypothetical protein
VVLGKRFKPRSCGLWHRVEMWQDNNVSNAFSVSIFRVKWWGLDRDSSRGLLGYDTV